MPDDIYAQPGQPLAVDQPENPFPGSYLGIRDLPQDLIEAHSQLVESLQAQGDRRSAGAALTDETNIVGVGIGLSDPPGTAGGAIEPGAPALTVYLDQPRDHADLENTLADTLNAPAVRSPRVPVKPVVIGQIDAIAHTQRLRPAPGGSSLFNAVDSTMFGTMACRATGRTAPRNQFAYVLSCNHVPARANFGEVNECVVQPSGGDGGTCPADQVAVLERFVKIGYFGPRELRRLRHCNRLFRSGEHPTSPEHPRWADNVLVPQLDGRAFRGSGRGQERPLVGSDGGHRPRDRRLPPGALHQRR